MAASKRLFVPIPDIQRSVDSFLRRYSATISGHSRNMSAYAEIAAYNAIIDHYVSVLRYKGAPSHIIAGAFKYKLQPTGDPRNFSHFRLTKRRRSFDVFNNISIESAHVARHYYNADVAVVAARSLRIESKESGSAAGHARTTYSIANRDVQTFFEVKNLPAFPELLFSFSGILYEIMPAIFRGQRSKRKFHISPGLICSFVGSGHSMYIRKALLARWHINIFVDVLFTRKLSARHEEDLRYIGNRAPLSRKAPTTEARRR